MIKLKSLLAPLIYVENDIHTPKEKNGEMKLLPLTTSVVLKKIQYYNPEKPEVEECFGYVDINEDQIDHTEFGI